MDWLSEHFGGSETLALPSNIGVLRPPGRIPGSCRFYKANPSALSVAILPSGTLMPNGESIVVYNANASNSLVLLDQSANVIKTITPQTVGTCYQLGGGANGTWFVETASAEEGSTITAGRLFLDLDVGDGWQTFNLRDYHLTHGLTDTETPAALRVWIVSGAIVGAAGTTAELETAFDTGEWPAGTTMLMFNYGTITGKGGRGGRGGDVSPGLLSQPGSDGTTGLRCRVPTVLLNYGTIQGGGGGGGGGIVSGAGNTVAGSGGGSGAGHTATPGGSPGSGSGGVAGVGGSAFVAGGGGAPGTPGAGGNGGGAGSAGSASAGGTAGGAAGSAILRLSAVSVTKLVTGTILGAEGTF